MQDPASALSQDEVALVSVVVPIAFAPVVAVAIGVAVGTVAVAIIAVVIAALVAIVVVSILIAIVAAALITVIVALALARFIGCVTFVAPVIGLAAVVSVVLDGFAEFVFGAGNATLAIISHGDRHAGKKEQSTKRRSSERGLAKQRLAEQYPAKQRVLQTLTQRHKRPPEGAALGLVGVLCVLRDVTQAQEKCRARTRKVTKQELKAEEREAQRIALRLVRPRDLTSFDGRFSAADVRDPSGRDRGHSSRARSANDARVHPTNDDRGSSSSRALGAVRVAHGPLACFRAHGARSLHGDDDPPWRFASGNRRH